MQNIELTRFFEQYPEYKPVVSGHEEFFGSAFNGGSWNLTFEYHDPKALQYFTFNRTTANPEGLQYGPLAKTIWFAVGKRNGQFINPRWSPEELAKEIEVTRRYQAEALERKAKNDLAI
ncbi:hypothetical protein UFOVP380_39 [uncultured Caudovirales phage]|uniref:Uncharacterized protein n=1 Tax=uncultured Caudovirales phage TaxID=2100421 RepID=A0A6J7X7R9_9CAUD|nr:hypothetical protein UFOVP380_39 [uncultured Caudovirales phage]